MAVACANFCTARSTAKVFVTGLGRRAELSRAAVSTIHRHLQLHTGSPKMMRPFNAVVVALLAAAVMLPNAARADDEDTIAYRQHIMKTVGELSAALGQIVQKKVVVAPDAFVSHTEALAVTAKMAKATFQPKVLGGESKPEVWSNWADFSKRLDELTAYTETVASAAKSGGIAAAGPRITDAHVCKDCHDHYRQEK
jgi:cytochrome c556